MTKKKRPRDPSRLATLDKLIRSRKDNDVILSEMVRHGYVNVTLKEVQNRRSLLKSRGEKFQSLWQVRIKLHLTVMLILM